MVHRNSFVLPMLGSKEGKGGEKIKEKQSNQ
jgi:hypothetical protein